MQSDKVAMLPVIQKIETTHVISVWRACARTECRITSLLCRISHLYLM